MTRFALKPFDKKSFDKVFRIGIWNNYLTRFKKMTVFPASHVVLYFIKRLINQNYKTLTAFPMVRFELTFSRPKTKALPYRGRTLLSYIEYRDTNQPLSPTDTHLLYLST